MYALEAFQKPLESASHFSKANRELISILKKCERTHQPIEKGHNKSAKEFSQ